MKRKKPLSGAPLIMRARGEKTDSIILDEIMKRPGTTISEIADKVGWTNGRVDGSVNRLVATKKVIVKHYLQRGMLVKKVYPIEQPVKPYDLISIPKEMINPELWKDKVTIYAMSRSTIGISPTEVKEWHEKAALKKHVSIEKNEENVTLKIPDTFSNFYQLENSDISLSAIGNLILVTVESILPVELPSTHPEERGYETTYYRIMLDVEGVSSYYPSQSVTLHEGEAKGVHLPAEALQTLQAILHKLSEEKIPHTATSGPVEPFRKIIKMAKEVS